MIRSSFIRPFSYNIIRNIPFIPIHLFLLPKPHQGVSFNLFSHSSLRTSTFSDMRVHMNYSHYFSLKLASIHYFYVPGASGWGVLFHLSSTQPLRSSHTHTLLLFSNTFHCLLLHFALKTREIQLVALRYTSCDTIIQRILIYYCVTMTGLL